MPPRQRRRRWQATAAWPSGAVMVFGVTAVDQAAAEARARQVLPGAPYHPRRRTRCPSPPTPA